MKIKIYTDGACSGNPGPGGWAVVVNLHTGCKTYSGSEEETTNNRMELKAVLETLKKVLKVRCTDAKFELYSDSAYVVNSINLGWVKNWKKSGWKTKKDEEVKNRDLWEQVEYLLEAIKDQKKDVVLVKVKGHSGNPLNELCDKIAKREAAQVERKK